ncbi:MAG: EfeM/EfeO family lipoprotein [Solirubrobacteraceae bacterium]
MNAKRRALPFSAVALVVAAVLVVALSGGGAPSSSAAAIRGGKGSTATGRRAAPQTAAVAAPAPLARYREGSPHVTSGLSIYSVQGQVAGAPTTPPDELVPVSSSVFKAPVTQYLAYSVRRLQFMETQIAKLQTALQAGDRAAAQAAWQGAFGYYLNLGAVYLQGPISELNDAIDGLPGGLPGGVSSAQFSGLHRLEHGLWTGAPLASLEPWARKLARDVARLATLLPRVKIDPLDYATRAHEILEDAVRDQLSGTDTPWSDAGVLGTSAGVVATTEVVKTLAGILKNRESVLPTVNADLAGLRTTLASIARAHGGRLPTTSQLTQRQSEQLDGSIGEALEGLAQIPGALETRPAPVTPQIPASAVKIDP